MKLRFWQNCISPHQAATLNALAEKDGITVEIMVQDEISDHRRKMGWSEPPLFNVRIVRGINDDSINGALRSTPDIEIFSGPWGYHGIRKAFLLAIDTGRNIAIMSEIPDWRGLGGLIRQYVYKMHSILYSSKIKYILAIGALAQDWFKKCGFPEEIIVPYAYTVTDHVSAKLTHSRSGTFRLIFVGQLVHLKGLDVLLAALGSLKQYDWSLDIVGDGPMRASLVLFSRILNIHSRVRFHGYLLNRDALKKVSESDLTVLPSRKDGWGAVINEALHRGLPVVCSSHCGGKSLIQRNRNGSIFRSGSIEDLRRTLEPYLAGHCTVPKKSNAIIEGSSQFTGRAVADYLVEVTQFFLQNGKSRPKCPWMQNIPKT